MNDDNQIVLLDGVALPISVGKKTAKARHVAIALLNGASIYAGANFAAKILGLVLMLVCTRYLTPADYGVITLAETIAIIVSAIGGLGVLGAVARLYFQYGDDARTLRSYTSTVIPFAVATSIFAAAIAMIVGPATLRLIDPGFSSSFFPFVAIAVLTATAQVAADFRQLLWQCEKRPTAFALMTIGTSLASVAAVIWLVVIGHRGAEGLLLGKCIAALVAGGVSFVLLQPWLSARMRGHFIRESLKFGLPLIPHSFMALGLVVADRFILERYRSLREVGLYSVAYTLGMVMFVVTLSVKQAWSPIYFETANEGDSGRQLNGRISSGLTLFLVGIAIVGVIFANEFVGHALDARYAEAGRLIPWTIAGYLFHGLFTLFHLAVLQGKRTNWLWPVSAAALAANIILNFLLVPRWGMYGAAWATTAAYGLEAAAIYWCAQRAYRLPYNRPQILLALIVLSLVLAVSQHHWSPSARVPVLLSALTASFALLFFLGKEDVREGVSVILNRNRIALLATKPKNSI